MEYFLFFLFVVQNVAIHKLASKTNFEPGFFIILSIAIFVTMIFVGTGHSSKNDPDYRDFILYGKIINAAYFLVLIIFGLVVLF